MPVKTMPVPSTTVGDVNLIVHGDHWDPYSILGLHELPAATGGSKIWVVRAFLPEARAGLGRRPETRRAGRTDRDGANPSGWLLHGGVPGSRRAVPLPASRGEPRGAFVGVRRPVFVRAGLDRLRPALARRGDALPELRAARRPPPDARRLPRRPFRGLGPERPAGQRDRQFQPLGRPPTPDGQPRRDRDLGDLHPGPRPGRSLQVRDQEPAQRLPRPEIRPLRLRGGGAAQDGLDRLGHHQLPVGRRGLDGAADRSAGARQADGDLRGPSRLLEAEGRARRWVPQLPRAGRAAGLAPRPHPFHPRRAAADHRASVRRKLGLSAGRLLRTDLAARHARTTSSTSSITCTGTATA